MTVARQLLAKGKPVKLQVGYQSAALLSHVQPADRTGAAQFESRQFEGLKLI